MDFMKPVFESGRIDFHGQRCASQLATVLLVGAGAFSLAAGFATQRLELCFLTYALGVVLTYVLVLPPWPFFRRHPVSWLARKSAPAAPTNGPRRTLVEDISDDSS
ncbi:hypothetical protein LPJ78_002986 [Coemansia sp. RSA 989]|nr:hypothetical protein LPJ68_003787 [Coemansia sp. RSA 1086]KAJ1748748.1 hypothetical protein LPJ79_004291 [Coemansia sp. RSA 1821]KAJ1865021.1 hypothetical protein LPJ78_002986 [Coemansia sp. RSA 989]KAJ1870669.1 hypothetical protein LPJ55_004473 [Coemansia sp. RSA 990]KAJ2669412.1 hypothetical protein IWW42_004615 [Coemansia sp. RSA 1085]